MYGMSFLYLYKRRIFEVDRLVMVKARALAIIIINSWRGRNPMHGGKLIMMICKGRTLLKISTITWMRKPNTPFLLCGNVAAYTASYHQNLDSLLVIIGTKDITKVSTLNYDFWLRSGQSWRGVSHYLYIYILYSGMIVIYLD